MPERACAQSGSEKAKGDDRRAAEWVLSKKGEVTILVRDKETIITSAAGLPKENFQVLRIFLRHAGGPANEGGTDPLGIKPPTAEDLQVLAGLSRLERLHLHGITAAPGLFDILKTLPKLSDLGWMADFTLVDAHMQRFRELPALESLRLDENDRLTVPALGTLAAAQPALQSLNLKLCGFNDSAVPHLLQFRKLTNLELPYTGIRSTSIAQLSALPQLETLVLSGNQLTAPIDWSRFPKLSIIRVQFNEHALAEDSIFENLGKLRKLESLELGGNVPLTLVQMRLLGALRTLEQLTLYGITVPDGSWGQLAGLAKLEEFKVSADAGPFGDADLMALAPCRSLKKVIAYKTRLTDAGQLAFKKKRGDVQLDVAK